MNMIRFMLSVLFAATSLSATELITSKYDFDTTIKNAKDFIIQKNIPIFAEFNHSQNANKAGLELNPTNVIVFGNPKVGTFLMQENQQIAIELPLRISIYKDSNNAVFVEATNIKALAKQYKIKNKDIVENIDKLLTELVKKSTGNL